MVYANYARDGLAWRAFPLKTARYSVRTCTRKRELHRCKN